MEEHLRAAVVHQPGATPVLEQFNDPQPGPGVSVGTLLAVTLNPLDLAFVNNQFPVRLLQPPCIAGYEAVVQRADGTRWYVTAPPYPYGTLAELVPVTDAEAFPIPAGLDPALAAAIGVAGLAGWLALDFATPADVRRAAYAQLAGHAADGKLTVDLEQTRLDGISATWERLKTGASRKLVVTP